MNDCYLCARDIRLGHHGGCPVLEMSRARRITFFGEALAAKYMTPEETQPHRVHRGFLQGDTLV